MKIIGWQLQRLIAEAHTALAGTQIEQIRRHPATGRLLLTLGSSRGKRWLVIGVRAASAACYWISRKESIAGYGEYAHTESFNRLRGARLEAIVLPTPDRLIRVNLVVPGREESDTEQHWALAILWAGGRSNIWLVDPAEDRILESWHAPSERAHAAAEGRDESIVTSVISLIPPQPQHLLDWRTLTLPDYRGLRREHPGLEAGDLARRFFWGIDTGVARLIGGRIAAARPSPEDHSGDDAANHWQEFETILAILRAAVNPETPLWLAPGAADPGAITIGMAGTVRPDNAVTGSLAELLAVCDRTETTETASAQERDRLRHAIRGRLGKLTRRLVALERILSETGRASRIQAQADLLGAHRQLLQRGMTEITLTDWSGAELKISLDPALGAQQNIDAFYRRARKAAAALDDARAEHPPLEEERRKWESLAATLEPDDVDPQVLERARAGLGMTAGAPAAARGNAGPRLPYREFAVGEDRVWVGRSARDNDDLTMHYANPGDLFLHAQGTPGSHVILKQRNGREEFDPAVIRVAAQIAAFFSRAKHSGLVPVVYAEARYVRKPRKAPPGTVSVERERSLMVRPSPPPGYHDGGGD